MTKLWYDHHDKNDRDHWANALHQSISSDPEKTRGRIKDAEQVKVLFN